MDCSPPGFSVHGVSQARILEWVAISFSRGFSWFRDLTCISCTGGSVLYCWATRWALCLPWGNSILSRVQKFIMSLILNNSAQTLGLSRYVSGEAGVWWGGVWRGWGMSGRFRILLLVPSADFHVLCFSVCSCEPDTEKHAKGCPQASPRF